MSVTKEELRFNIKEKIKRFSAETLLDKSKLISMNLRQLLKELYSKKNHAIHQLVIGGYAPLKDEADWTLFIQDFSANLAFPSMSAPASGESVMVFCRARLDELVLRKDFGVAIRVPSICTRPVVPEITLVPGLAFDASGQRLGRGGGFYDKFLMNYCGLKIGIGFEEQMVLEIPTQKHDQSVDIIVTDKMIRWIKALPDN